MYCGILNRVHKYNVLKFEKWECIINLYSTLLLQMEIKIILSRLLQTFLISLPRDYQFRMAQRTTLQTKDSVKCTLELTSCTYT